MNYLCAFLFPALICGLGQIIIDNTRYTAGHVTSLFTVMGVVLSFLGIYPKLINCCGAGATILITNFGNMLYTSGIQGFYNSGLIGIFANLLSKSSLAIVSAVIFAFIFTIFFDSKD